MHWTQLIQGLLALWLLMAVGLPTACGKTVWSSAEQEQGSPEESDSPLTENAPTGNCSARGTSLARDRSSKCLGMQTNGSSMHRCDQSVARRPPWAFPFSMPLRI
jgi:hypothetical protein